MKRLRIWIGLAVGAVVCYLAWQFHSPKRAEVEQRSADALREVCSLELTNTWRTVNASGGLVGAVFYIRSWREYFLEKEGDVETLEALSSELGSRHSRVDFSFLPSGDGIIMPHRDSAVLAPWWQPESNTEPMYMFASFVEGGRTVLLYGYMKTTNSLLYIHIIER